MALASFKSAKSVVGLSESPVFHYQFSSICDAISNLARTSGERDERRKSLQRLFLARQNLARRRRVFNTVEGCAARKIKEIILK